MIILSYLIYSKFSLPLWILIATLGRALVSMSALFSAESTRTIWICFESTSDLMNAY